MTQRFSTAPVLCRFCSAESNVDFSPPITECNLNIWTTEAASETDALERERETDDQGHLLLDVLKFWTSGENSHQLGYPQDLFLLHTYTHLSHKSLLEWQLPFLDHKKTFTWTMRKNSKRTFKKNLLLMTNPAELWREYGCQKSNKNKTF